MTELLLFLLLAYFVVKDTSKGLLISNIRYHFNKYFNKVSKYFNKSNQLTDEEFVFSCLTQKYMSVHNNLQ